MLVKRFKMKTNLFTMKWNSTGLIVRRRNRKFYKVPRGPTYSVLGTKLIKSY